MLQGQFRPSTGRGNGGFALIIVLWTLVFTAFITAQLVGSGRIESRIAGNVVANAVTEAAADGAVYHAIFNLLGPSLEERWPLDGSVRELAIGDCRVMVRLYDEAARVNPNLASPALLEALLRVSGSDEAEARGLTDAIGEWVQGSITTQQAEQAIEKYRAAGLDYGPPAEPLETLDELKLVLGMTPDVFAAIRPHLSLFAPAEPVLARADPVVRMAVASLGRSEPSGRPARQSGIPIARITVLAEGPGNSRASRTAIVRVAPRARSFAVLSWSDAD
jgi:general secretion pathway protein K